MNLDTNKSNFIGCQACNKTTIKNSDETLKYIIYQFLDIIDRYS